MSLSEWCRPPVAFFFQLHLLKVVHFGIGKVGVGATALHVTAVRGHEEPAPSDGIPEVTFKSNTA